MPHPAIAINWVEVSLNGKAGRMMVVDLDAEEIRLSASLAAEIGLQPDARESTVLVLTIGGSPSF